MLERILEDHSHLQAYLTSIHKGRSHDFYFVHFTSVINEPRCSSRLDSHLFFMNLHERAYVREKYRAFVRRQKYTYRIFDDL